MTRGSSLVVLAFAATVSLIACGGSGSPSAGASPTPSPSPSPSPTMIAGPIDACTLVTADEATSAAGAPLTNMTSSAGAPTGVCIYANSDTQTAILVFAQTYPDVSSAQAVSAGQVVAALNNGYTVSNAKTVSGIGDKAVEYTFSTSGPTGVAIFVFKDNVVMMIALSPGSDPTKVEDLAKTAVTRL